MNVNVVKMAEATHRTVRGITCECENVVYVGQNDVVSIEIYEEYCYGPPVPAYVAYDGEGNAVEAGIFGAGYSVHYVRPQKAKEDIPF